MRPLAAPAPAAERDVACRSAALRLDVKVLRDMGIGDAAIWAQITELVDSIKMKAGDGNAAA